MFVRHIGMQHVEHLFELFFIDSESQGNVMSSEEMVTKNKRRHPYNISLVILTSALTSRLTFFVCPFTSAALSPRPVTPSASFSDQTVIILRLFKEM